jgi:hypothetical protein
MFTFDLLTRSLEEPDLFTYHFITLSNFYFFFAATNWLKPWNLKIIGWKVLYIIMYSIVFYSACLFLIYIGGCWFYGCLLVKSEQEEKLVKIFDRVSWKICYIYDFFIVKNYHLQQLIPLKIHMELTHVRDIDMYEVIKGHR